jgi:hypothetical protein
MSSISRDWHPPKYDRVRGNTPDKVNREIDELTASYLSLVGTEPHAIRKRLWEIDREWHVDRALIGVFSVLGGFTAHRALLAAQRGHRFSGWRLLLWTQLGFLLHHAIRGWCPPVSVLRRLGFRTDKEIAAERIALEKRLATTKGI